MRFNESSENSRVRMSVARISVAFVTDAPPAPVILCGASWKDPPDFVWQNPAEAYDRFRA